MQLDAGSFTATTNSDGRFFLGNLSNINTSAGGNLSINSSRNIDIQGQLNIGGNSTFSTDNSRNVTLNNDQNTFGSYIHITGGNNVDIDANSPVLFGSSSSAFITTGTLNITTSNQTITQNGAINLGSNVDIQSNGGDISLQTDILSRQGSINAGSGTITLNGSDGIDNFTFDISNGPNLIARGITLDGRGGNDNFTINSNLPDNSIITLNGGDDNDTFVIGSSLPGNSMLTINGGTGNDTFNIANQNLNAIINGGDGNSVDTLSLTYNGNSTWTIDPTAGNTVNNLNFSDIEVANGSDGGEDTFNILSNDVQTINGRGGDDRFILSATDLLITLNGGAGGGDIADYNAVTEDLIVNIGGGINAVAGVEQYIGNYDPSNPSGLMATLSREGSEFNLWTIQGSNAGTLADGNTNNNITFSGFNILQGSTTASPMLPADDQFTIESGATFNGTIHGGIGNNIITNENTNGLWRLDQGMSFAGTLEFSSSDITLFESIQTFNGSGSDTLQGINQETIWTINTIDSTVASQSAPSNIITFNGMITIQGGSDVDRFDINSTSHSNALLFNGGDGNDIYTILDTSDSTSGNTLSFNGEGDTDQLNAGDRDNIWIIENALVNTLNNTINFQAIEQLNGNASRDEFTFLADASIREIDGDGASTNRASTDSLTILSDAGNIINWNITENNVGVITNESNTTTLTIFSAIANLTGGLGDDNFTINENTSVLASVRNIVGAAGNNSLSRAGNPNNVTRWNITGDNQGNITSVVNSFSDIQNLNGSTGSDRFLFTSEDSNISGIIDGQAGITDSLHLEALTNGITVALGENNVDASRLNVVRVENIIAAGNDADPSAENINRIEIADDSDLNWTIDNTNGGIIRPRSNASEENSVRFDNFGTLVGSAGLDSFILADMGDITGSINGGDVSSPSVQDNVDISQQDNTVIDLANNNYLNIEHYIGNNRNSGIAAGDNPDNIWIFDSTRNSGRLSSETENITFEGFANITGGNQIDTFNFDGGSVSGEVRGGEGNDILNITLRDNQNSSSTINFIGNGVSSITTNEKNRVNISQVPTDINSYQASYNPQQDDSASLIYNRDESNQRLEVSFQQVSEVNDSINVDIFTINDINGQNDTINILDNNRFTFNDFTPIAISNNKTNIVINGEDLDTVNIGSIFNVNNRFEVQRSAVEMNQSSNVPERYISAQTIRFIDNTHIGSEANPLQLRTNQLQLGAINGNSYINNSNIAGPLELMGINRPAGEVIINADSDIVASAEIVTENALNLSSEGNINFTDIRHQLSGPLSLSAQGNIQSRIQLASAIGG